MTSLCKTALLLRYVNITAVYCRTRPVRVHAEIPSEKERNVDRRQNGLSNLLEFPTFNLSTFFSTTTDEKKGVFQLPVDGSSARKVR